MMRISEREKTEVFYENWKMSYYPDGKYYIIKDGEVVTDGQYDAIIADSYNDEMSEEDRVENLTRDLISWVKKAIEKKVTD